MTPGLMRRTTTRWSSIAAIVVATCAGAPWAVAEPPAASKELDPVPMVMIPAG